MSDSEKAGWRSLRLRFIAALAWAFGGMVAIALLQELTELEALPAVIAVVWLVGCIPLALRTSYARCPKCGEFYYRNRREAMPIVWFTYACRNCGTKPPK